MSNFTSLGEQCMVVIPTGEIAENDYQGYKDSAPAHGSNSGEGDHHQHQKDSQQKDEIFVRVAVVGGGKLVRHQSDFSINKTTRFRFENGLLCSSIVCRVDRGYHRWG